MAKFVRTMLKPIALLLAIVQNASATPAVGSHTSVGATRAEPLSLTGLVKRIGQDPALRDRFLRDPRSVLREAGIDPGLYDLPDRMDEGQIDRFLGDWIGHAEPAAGLRPAVEPPGADLLAANMMPPIAVYGPPPLPVPQPEPPRNKPSDKPKPPPDDTVKPAPTPPAPVYGPPPGSSR